MAYCVLLTRTTTTCSGTMAWVTPTPPGSGPVSMITNQHYAFESDIWIVDTETGQVNWQWISNTGAREYFFFLANGVFSGPFSLIAFFFLFYL